MSETETELAAPAPTASQELHKLQVEYNARAFPGREATAIPLALAYSRGASVIPDATPDIRHLYGLIRARSYLALLDSSIQPHNTSAPDRDLLPPTHPFSTRAPAQLRTPTPRYQRALTAAIVMDSLGRPWNSLLHPRDRHGKFIPTFGSVRLFKRSLSTGSRGDEHYATGTYMGANPDGSVNVRIGAVNDPSEKGTLGHIKSFPSDQVESSGGGGGSTAPGEPGRVADRVEKAHIGNIATSAGSETQEYRNVAARNTFNEGIRDLGDVQKTDLTTPDGATYHVGDTINADVGTAPSGGEQTTSRTGTILDMAHTSDGRDSALVRFDNRADTPTPAGDTTPEISLLDLGSKEVHPGAPETKATIQPQSQAIGRTLPPHLQNQIDWGDYGKPDYTLDGGPKLPQEIQSPSDLFDRGAEEWLHDPRNPNRIGARPHIPNQMYRGTSDKSVSAKRTPTPQETFVSGTTDQAGANRPAAPSRQKMKHVGDREIRTADGESAGVGSVIVFNPPSGSGRRSSQYTPGVIGVVTNINENANKGYGGARVIVWDPDAPNPDPAATEPGAWRFLSMTHLSGDRFSLVKEADPSLLHSLGKGIDIGGGMTLMPQHKRIARTLTKEQIAAGVKPIDQRSAVDVNGAELRKGDHVVGRTRAGQLVHGHIQNIRPGEDLMDVTPYGGGEAITISTNRTRFMRKASGPYGTAGRDDVFYEDAADFNMPVFDHASLDEALAEAGATDAERALFHGASAGDIASRLIDSDTRKKVAALVAHYNEMDLNDPERHSPEARTARMLDHVFRAGLAGRLLASDGGDVQARPEHGQTRAEGDLSEMEAIFPQSFGDFYSDDALSEYLLPDARAATPEELARSAQDTADQAGNIPTDDARQMTIEMQTVAAWLKAENHPRGPQIQANAAIQAAVAAIAKANQPHRTDEEKADLLARAADNLRAIGDRPGAQGLKPTLDAIADKVDKYAQENGYDRGLRPNAPNAPNADFTPPPPPTPQAPTRPTPPAAPTPAPTPPPAPNVPEAPPAPTPTPAPTPNVPEAPPAPTPPPAPAAPEVPPTPEAPAVPTPDFISVADDGTITINDPDVAFDTSVALSTMTDENFTRIGGGTVDPRTNVLTLTDPAKAADALDQFVTQSTQELDDRRVPMGDPERQHLGNVQDLADFVRAQGGPAAAPTTPTDQANFTPTAEGTGPSPSLPISPADDDWEQTFLDSLNDKPQVPALDPATVTVPKPNTVDGTPNKDEMVAALSSGDFQNVLNLLDTWYSQVGYNQTVDAFRSAHTMYARTQGNAGDPNDPFNVPGWDDARRDLDAWKADVGSRMMVQDGFDMPANSQVMSMTAAIYSDLHHDRAGFTRDLVAIMDGTSPSAYAKDPEVRAQAAMAMAQLTEHMNALNGHPQKDAYAAWYRDQAVRLRSGQEFEPRTRPRIEGVDDPNFKSVRDANGNILYWTTADGKAVFQDTRGGTAVFRPATPAEVMGNLGNNSYPITVIDGQQYVQVGKVYLTNSAENRRTLYTNYFTPDAEVLTPVKKRLEWYDIGVFSGQTRFAPGGSNWQSISDVQAYDLDRQTRAMSMFQQTSEMRRTWGEANTERWLRANGLDPGRVQFPTARVHRNGHVNIEVGADTVTAWGDNYDANLKTLTDQIDKLMGSRDAAVWDRPVFVRVSNDVFANKKDGVMAYAYRGNHFVAIKSTFAQHSRYGVNGPNPVLAEQIVKDELATRGFDEFVRDSIGHNNMAATLVHEWGHMVDMTDATLTGRKAQTAEAIRNGILPTPTSSRQGTSSMAGRLRINDAGEGEWFDGDIAYDTFKSQMSGNYAKDSEAEFVAEAFTEWHLTDGKTNSLVAQFLFGDDAQRIAAFDKLLGETSLIGKMRTLSSQEIQNYMDQGMTRAEARYRAYRNKYSIHMNDVTGHGGQYTILTGAQSTQDFLQRMYGVRGMENMTPEEIQNYLASIAPNAALAFAQGVLPESGVPGAPAPAPAASSAPAGAGTP